ncbi:hypothetical protein KIN20_000217 [Parelaphostrongylus tenuis]|uniref:Uncharacterized protein n=1 Tax=Parelaphostrongylus tenuis TaxID=148309 RepID=A0AAD5QFF1_PARTN|nr:hypothetical protein KIN20_000217 [Parelaphostrongylus tenuis]
MYFVSIQTGDAAVVYDSAEFPIEHYWKKRYIFGISGSFLVSETGKLVRCGRGISSVFFRHRKLIRRSYRKFLRHKEKKSDIDVAHKNVARKGNRSDAFLLRHIVAHFVHSELLLLAYLS